MRRKRKRGGGGQKERGREGERARVQTRKKNLIHTKLKRDKIKQRSHHFFILMNTNRRLSKLPRSPRKFRISRGESGVEGVHVMFEEATGKRRDIAVGKSERNEKKEGSGTEGGRGEIWKDVSV